MRPLLATSFLLLAGLAVVGCPSWEPGGWDDDTGDDDSAADDDYTGDDDSGDDDTGDDDSGDDDTGDDDTGDDDTGSGTDSDGDGWTEADGDCHDGNANIYPGAPELCDGFDDDCDGVTPPDEVDGDGDGWMICVGDCDDTEPAVNPGEQEIPADGLDNDCDGVTDPIWMPTAGAADAQGDHNGYVVDLATLEYRQDGSRLWFRILSYTTFDDADAMLDVYVDNGTDLYTLTWDQGTTALWSDINGWAGPLTTPPSLVSDTASIDSLILGIDMGEVGLGGASQMGTAVGAHLDGNSYDDQYPDGGQLATVSLGPAATLAVDSLSFQEITGDGDVEVEPGELWNLDIVVRNDGDIDASGVVATLQPSVAISVPVPDGSYGVIAAGATATSFPPFRIDVGPGAAGVETLRLRLEDATHVWEVGVEIPIGNGLAAPAYERYEYRFDVLGNSVTGDLVVTLLDSGQTEVCDHRFTFVATHAYGFYQGGLWADVADETVELTQLVDTGLGSCPPGYHDLYVSSPSEMLNSAFTLLSFISCDVADGTFHGDDIVTGNGSGSQESWCNDVGPAVENFLGSGPPEGVAIMLTGYGDLAGLGNFTYYPAADGVNYWAHMGMLMLGAGNGSDPLYGMLGEYELWSNWIFGI